MLTLNNTHTFNCNDTLCTLVLSRLHADTLRVTTTVVHGDTTHVASWTMDEGHVRKYGLVEESYHAKGLSSTCGGLTLTTLIEALKGSK